VLNNVRLVRYLPQARWRDALLEPCEIIRRLPPGAVGTFLPPVGRGVVVIPIWWGIEGFSRGHDGMCV